MRVKVRRAGLQTTVQDAGRRGLEHMGVMVNGWLDDYAAAWANRLVGNEPNAALLEITLLGPELMVLDSGWLALTGADLTAAVNGQPWPPGSAREVYSGDLITFSSAVRGARAYVSGTGGLEIDPVLGSRSTDLVARFGGLEGRAVRDGDVLVFAGGQGTSRHASVDTCWLSSEIRILPGVRLDRLATGSFDRLVQSPYRVSPQSDRVGLRMAGAVIEPGPSAHSISEGIAIGSIEVPPGGELLILLKSRGSIGGYPTLAHVIQADWPLLAQLKPGDMIRFRAVSMEDARQALVNQQQLLSSEMIEEKLDTPLASAPKATKVITVSAPMWCVAYVAQNPGQPPLVKEGDHVVVGQLLAVLEVMKQFYDLVSPAAGIVRSVGFQDAEMVDEGTVLFEIEGDLREEGTA